MSLCTGNAVPIELAFSSKRHRTGWTLEEPRTGERGGQNPCEKHWES